jgi:hypothetical protein
MMKSPLTSDNFLLYASKLYSNPNSTGIDEFYEDLSKIKYIKRLLIRFKRGGDLKERLILNHVIILQNVFGAEGCCRILFFKLSKDLHPLLKSFLAYLNYLPVSIPEVNIDEIQSDHRLDKILSELK